MEARLLINWPQNREIILDYLGGPNVITKVLKCGKRRRQKKNQSNRIGEELNSSFLKPAEEMQPCQYLVWAQVTSVTLFTCRTISEEICAVSSHWLCGPTATVGNEYAAKDYISEYLRTCDFVNFRSCIWAKTTQWIETDISVPRWGAHGCTKVKPEHSTTVEHSTVGTWKADEGISALTLRPSWFMLSVSLTWGNF